MNIELSFTDKEITAWGGMALIKQMLDRMDFNQALDAAGLPQQCSNRGYSPKQLVTQFLLTIWCGGNRFQHGEVTRFDLVLGKLFDIKRMAGSKAIMRLFDKFDQMYNEQVFGSLYRWLFGLLQVDCLTLDLDSTVITRHGLQEGAQKGYNPRKPGRRSHHPLMAFVADVRILANCWLRPGNTGSANNINSFLDATLYHLSGKKVGLLRADSGFSETTFLDKVEGLAMNYGSEAPPTTAKRTGKC